MAKVNMDRMASKKNEALPTLLRLKDGIHRDVWQKLCQCLPGSYSQKSLAVDSSVCQFLQVGLLEMRRQGCFEPLQRLPHLFHLLMKENLLAGETMMTSQIELTFLVAVG